MTANKAEPKPPYKVVTCAATSEALEAALNSQYAQGWQLAAFTTTSGSYIVVLSRTGYADIAEAKAAEPKKPK